MVDDPTATLIERNTTHHSPRDVDDIRAHESIRLATRQFMMHIADRCPDSRERSLAITKAEEAMMWANAALARNRG